MIRVLPLESPSATSLRALSCNLKSGAGWPGLSSLPASVMGLPLSVTELLRVVVMSAVRKKCSARRVRMIGVRQIAVSRMVSQLQASRSCPAPSAFGGQVQAYGQRSVGLRLVQLHAFDDDCRIDCRT